MLEPSPINVFADISFTVILFAFIVSTTKLFTLISLLVMLSPTIFVDAILFVLRSPFTSRLLLITIETSISNNSVMFAPVMPVN